MGLVPNKNKRVRKSSSSNSSGSSSRSGGSLFGGSGGSRGSSSSNSSTIASIFIVLIVLFIILGGINQRQAFIKLGEIGHNIGTHVAGFFDGDIEVNDDGIYYRP